MSYDDVQDFTERLDAEKCSYAVIVLQQRKDGNYLADRFYKFTNDEQGAALIVQLQRTQQAISKAIQDL